MSESEKKVIEDIMKEAGLDRDSKENKLNDSNSFDFGMLLILMLMISFGFNTHSDNSYYLQGKIDAYENILKGFD